MVNVAVILSGCGHMDGAEVRESVLTLLSLDRRRANVTMFAPDMEQYDVINHLTHQPMQEKRNVLVEAARIARGEIKDITHAKAKNFDALILPGGYGVAKNLSNLALSDPSVSVHPELQRVLNEFIDEKKPIGAICIAPAVVVAALAKGQGKSRRVPKVTVGDDKEGMIISLGGEHQVCAANEVAIDPLLQIASCSAYMRSNDRISDIADGIDKVIAEVLARVSLHPTT